MKPTLKKRCRVTIAAGLICSNGIVFGADTDESIGELKRRVHKIPSHMGQPPILITGACLNGHLMDTATEHIINTMIATKPATRDEVNFLPPAGRNCRPE
jgi:hypothetical protein